MAYRNYRGNCKKKDESLTDVVVGVLFVLGGIQIWTYLQYILAAIIIFVILAIILSIIAIQRKATAQPESEDAPVNEDNGEKKKESIGFPIVEDSC